MEIVVHGVAELLAKLNKLSELEEVVTDCIKELMLEAQERAERKYALQRNGNFNYTASVEWIPNGWKLTMSGEDVGFLEFGAGVFTDDSNPFANEVDFPVVPGSWSASHEHSANPNARYFAKNGFWWWYNPDVHESVRYTGLYPTRGMLSAVDYVRDNIVQRITERINAWIER